MRKQDRQPVRNVTGLEIKYDIEKNFAELRGLARETQNKVQEQAKITEAELSLRIRYDETGKIVSMLNASADVIRLKSNRLEIESDHFTLSTDGTVEATAGIIGGCEIKNGKLIIPVANITGTLTAANINTDDLKVKAANITGTLTASQIDADDLKIKAANVTGTLTASQIDATNLKVNAANVTGTLLIGQLPTTVAETSDIPKKVSQLTNDSGYKNESGVVSIIDGKVTADYVNALGISVYSAQIKDKLTSDKIDVAGLITAGGIAIGDDIPTKISELENDAEYEDYDGIVTIIDGRITADYIEALEIKVKSAQIDGKLTATQIDSTGLDVQSGTIGGWVIGYDFHFDETIIRTKKGQLKYFSYKNEAGTDVYGHGYVFTALDGKGIVYLFAETADYENAEEVYYCYATQNPVFSNASLAPGGGGTV